MVITLSQLTASLQATKGYIDDTAEDILSVVADEFDNTVAYAIGDYVTYEESLYRFTVAHSAGDFDSSEVDEVTIVDELDNKVDDVTINNSSIVSNGVANIPIAGTSNLGVVKVNAGYGIKLESGALRTNEASVGLIKQGTDPDYVIVPKNQHESTFYGLAKAAGDSTQAASSNTVGTYTTEAKAAIQTMFGIPDAITAAVPTNNNQLTNGAGYQTATDVNGLINTAVTAITSAQIEALFA